MLTAEITDVSWFGMHLRFDANLTTSHLAAESPHSKLTEEVVVVMFATLN